jgi:hypothetical protein
VSGNSRRTRRVALVVVFAWLGLGLAPGVARAVMLSVEATGTVVGGVSYSRFDVVWFDPLTNTSQLVLGNSVFGQSTRLDALQLLPGGQIVLSIAPNSRTLAGVPIRDGDVVLYDPVAGAATILLSESGFASGADVDAVQLLPNGHLLLSTEDNETLFGVSFRDGDVVEWDPLGGGVSVVFSESLFAGGEDVDALWLGSDGSLYLSTRSNAVLAGLSFQANDLVRYDPGTGTASLALDGAGLPANVLAVSAFLDEPRQLALVAGLTGLFLFPNLRRGRGRGDGR